MLTYYLSPHRSPDEAKIKTKMLYASSKDALRRALVGIASEIQGTDHSEIAYTEGAFLPTALSNTSRHEIDSFAAVPPSNLRALFAECRR